MFEEVGGAGVGNESMNTTRIHYTHVRFFKQVKKKKKKAPLTGYYEY